MASRVELGEWDTLSDELRRFGHAGSVTTPVRAGRTSNVVSTYDTCENYRD